MTEIRIEEEIRQQNLDIERIFSSTADSERDFNSQVGSADTVETNSDTVSMNRKWKKPAKKETGNLVSISKIQHFQQLASNKSFVNK